MSVAPERPAPAAFALPAARWGQRAGALLLDLLVQLLLVVAVAVVVGFVTDWGEYRYEDTDATATAPYWAAWAVGVGIASAFLYPWLLLGLMRGRTPGRRIVGIRVVRNDGGPVGLGTAFLREALAKGALGLFTVPLLLSFLWPLWDPHQRAIHDLVCSTRVVLDGEDEVDAFGGDRLAAPVPGSLLPPPPPAPGRPAGHGEREDLAGRIGLDG